MSNSVLKFLLFENTIAHFYKDKDKPEIHLQHFQTRINNLKIIFFEIIDARLIFGAAQ